MSRTSFVLSEPPRPANEEEASVGDVHAPSAIEKAEFAVPTNEHSVCLWNFRSAWDTDSGGKGTKVRTSSQFFSFATRRDQSFGHFNHGAASVRISPTRGRGTSELEADFGQLVFGVQLLKLGFVWTSSALHRTGLRSKATPWSCRASDFPRPAERRNASSSACQSSVSVQFKIRVFQSRMRRRPCGPP